MLDCTKTTVNLDLPIFRASESIVRASFLSFMEGIAVSTDSIMDLQRALGEAVMNCIVHAYPKGNGRIYISMTLQGNELILTVRDTGIGIKDIEQARMALFTTKEGSSGMGFTVMETFADDVDVTSAPKKGTTVTIKRNLNIIL